MKLRAGLEKRCLLAFSISLLLASQASSQLILNEANAVGVNSDTYLQDGEVYEGWDYGTFVPHSGNNNDPLTGTPKGNPFPEDVDSGTVGNQTTLPNGWNGTTGWARIKFNGGDWWELVITEDHTDLRGWTLYWENNDDLTGIGANGANRSMVKFTNDRSFANLRAGTILTMSEDASVDEIRDEYPTGDPNVPIGFSSENDTGHNYDLSTDTSFNPFDGNNDWNVHYHVDETFTDVGTATQYFEGFSNIKVDNDEWRFAIFDNTSNLTFADVDSATVPRSSLDLTTGLVQDFVGESAAGWGTATGAGGVNNQEVITLLGDPDNPTEGSATHTEAANFYEDTDWSSFGSPNVYNPRPGAIEAGGENDDNLNGVQDFSNMRDPVELNTYDFNAAGEASFASGSFWELANDDSAAGSAPAANWTARVLNSGASDVTAVVDTPQTVEFVEAGATGAGDATIEIEGGATLTANGRAIVDDGGELKIQLDGLTDGQGKLEAGENIDLFSGSSLELEIVGEVNPNANMIKAGTYTIVESTGGAVQGVFSSVTDLGVYDDDVGITYNADSITITLDHDIIPGDVNLDGTVTVGDLNTAVLTLTGPGTGDFSDGDLTGDGLVTVGDVNGLILNLGTSVSSLSASVPEPSSLVLFAVGAALATARRRRG